MAWQVAFYDGFAEEFEGYSDAVRKEILAKAHLLVQFGPQLARPHADHLKGSRHANMKELRLNADDGEWRVAFAFDVDRQAVLLCAGDKRGARQESKFYKTLIATADERFDAHNAKAEKLKALRPQSGSKKDLTR